jgi:alkylation response protein AidB-like acyl-CoA dehydrogenase
MDESPRGEGTLSERALQHLLSALAETAIPRDLAGGSARAERKLIRASGLLALSIDPSLGGLGVSFGGVLDVVRRIAAVDSSLAHVFAFHHLMLATTRLFGSAEQATRAERETVEGKLFWGNALNPKDTRLVLSGAVGARRLHGEKSFCSGAVDSDRLIVSAIDAHTQKLVVAAIPTARRGVTVQEDWDAFGQRQTDSGTVAFDGVAVEEAALLRTPGPLGSVRASLRPCLAQAILAHVYLGLAEGALGEAQRRHLREPSARSEDPFVLARAGKLSLAVDGAGLFAERARRELDRGLAAGDALTARERGEIALSVARAKVSASDAALAVGQGIFELLGPRATTRRDGLDRFWRNARVHTLHDPLDHKLRELGERVLLDRVPTPSFYA